MVPRSCFGGQCGAWPEQRGTGLVQSRPSPRQRGEGSTCGPGRGRTCPSQHRWWLPGLWLHWDRAPPPLQACLRSLSGCARPLGCGLETLAQENGPGACSRFQVQGRESALCVRACKGTRSAPGTPGRLVFSWLRFVGVSVSLPQLGRGGVGEVLALWFLRWGETRDALQAAEREGEGGTRFCQPLILPHGISAGEQGRPVSALPIRNAKK